MTLAEMLIKFTVFSIFFLIAVAYLISMEGTTSIEKTLDSRGYIKFNISEIPESAEIDAVTVTWEFECVWPLVCHVS